MHDLPPVTDDDRRNAREWAENIMSYPSTATLPRSAARVILAEIPAPPKPLSEEMREWAGKMSTLGHAPEGHDLEDVALAVAEDLYALTREVAQLEKERDEARAEAARAARVSQAEHDLKEARESLAVEGRRAEKIAAERDEARAEWEALDTTNDHNNHYAVQKDAESTTERTNTADVPAGEAWLVECRGERRNALKDNSFDIQWNTVSADGWPLVEDSEDITLISRLVPAPRVITNPDELDKLAPTSIFRDGSGWPGGITDQGGIMRMNGVVLDSTELLKIGPVTVLWEPEVSGNE